MLTKRLTKDITDELSARYASTLKEFLIEGGEASLRQAYDLGRKALIAGLGVLDMAELHHRALKLALVAALPAEMEPRMKKATVFFEESLSPFEITHQGYRDAVEIMRRVANFSFTASQEVKAPLNSIVSSACMLQEMLQADRHSPEGKLIANMLNAVAILQSRTDDMLDLANMYAGALSLRIRSVPLGDYLYQVFEDLEPGVRWGEMQFNLQIDHDLPQVELDPDRMQQVLANLVQNAVKHASQGGQIDIEAMTQDANVVIRIKDQGSANAGMQDGGLLPAGERQVSRDSGNPGTGLGLLLCQQIVEAHSGRLSLIDRAGRGSTIEVRLPIASAGAAR